MPGTAAALVWTALLAGCIDHLLEAPYVLATGVADQPRAMSPTTDQAFLVAGQGGVSRVDGSGRVQAVATAPAVAAVAHSGWVALVDAQGVTFGTLDDTTHRPTHRVAVTGVDAAQAWCDLQLLLLVGDQLLLAGPQDDAPRPWATAPAGARDLALGMGQPCAQALVLTPTQLFAVGPDGTSLLAQGLVDARAVAVDRHQQPWVVQGDPLVLARVRDGQATTFARHLGDVVDLHFGTGGLLHPDNAFLLTREGTVDYVRVPEQAP